MPGFFVCGQRRSVPVFQKFRKECRLDKYPLLDIQSFLFLTPLAFALLLVTALVNALLRGTSNWGYILGMFLSNVVVAWSGLEIARSVSRKARGKVEGPKPVVEAAHH